MLQPCFHSRLGNGILRFKGHGRSERLPVPQKGDAMASHPYCLFGEHLPVMVAEG
jgi:hypothetical protein